MKKYDLKTGQFGKGYRINSVRDTEASVRDTDKEQTLKIDSNNKLRERSAHTRFFY